MKLSAKYLLLLLCSFALFSCDKEDVTPADNSLVLIPSNAFVVVSSSSVIDFTVTFADKDITSDSDVLIFEKSSSGSELLTDKRFTVSRAGTYNFYAIYGNEMSETVSVRGITNLPNAATDPAPAQFDSFHKKVLGTLGTGTWCTNCPTLLEPIHEYMATTDDFIMSEAHSGDIMESVASTSVISLLGISGFPTLYLNMSSKGDNVVKNGSTSVYIRKQVEARLDEKALTAISANSTYEGSTVCVRADVKVAEEGQFRIGALLVEDDVYSDQSNATEDWMNYHEAAICASYPTTFSLNEILGGTATQKAGSTHLFYCEFDFTKLASVVKRDNCRVIIYTVNNSIGEVDNVIEFDMGDSHPFVYDL